MLRAQLRVRETVAPVHAQFARTSWAGLGLDEKSDVINQAALVFRAPSHGESAVTG